jgi:hypothetical protein
MDMLGYLRQYPDIRSRTFSRATSDRRIDPIITDSGLIETSQKAAIGMFVGLVAAPKARTTSRTLGRRRIDSNKTLLIQ